MLEKIIISTVTSLATLLIVSLVRSKPSAIQKDSISITKEQLCKKWNLSTYEAYGELYPPEKQEKNDYIFLKNDMTYITVSEGKKESGKWTINSSKGYIQLFDTEKQSLKIYILQISKTKLSAKIDIEELEEVTINYTAS